MPYYYSYCFCLEQDKKLFILKKTAEFDLAKRIPASEFQQNVGKKSRMRKESILVLDS